MTAATTRPTLDVSHLPAESRDSRSPTWWGNTLFMLIETTTVALLLASYVYLWRNFPQSGWPPPAARHDPSRGREAIARLGCAACHTVPGVPGDANVGPPLDRVGSRVYLAGVQLNTPANMARWLKDPPAVNPKTAMPNVGATDDEVRDISAYLYTLR